MKRKKIAVLGSEGAMGKVIAKELGRLNYDVRGFDVLFGDDITKPETLRYACTSSDVVVSSLPGNIGETIARRAMIENEAKAFIDLSFSPENPKFECKGTLIYDCGFSPGLSHLIVGNHMHRKGNVDRVAIYVGGVAANREQDLVLTWSPVDLQSEYVRQARVKTNGTLRRCRPITPHNTTLVQLPSSCMMEAFLSDGARSLLNWDSISHVFERTLRWPGHMEKIREKGPNAYIRTLPREGTDYFILHVEVDDSAYCVEVLPKNGLSAMARGTALSCCGFVQLLAEKLWDQPGCWSPDQIGHKGKGLFIFDYLDKFHEIRVEKTKLLWSQKPIL